VHRFTLATVEGTKGDTTTLEAGALAVARDASVIIGAPLRGGLWYINNGPSNDSRHRRSAVPLNGQMQHGGRFALDLVKFRDDGSRTRDPATYGSEVLAVADALVVTAIDGIPDNWVPGQRPASPDARAVPMTAETVRGNTVALDLGAGRYAHYAHLQPGSVRVKSGDRVRRGQVLGLLGNSGNSTGPHLHFQVSSSPGLGGHGLPFVFDAFELVAMVPDRPDWREHAVMIPPGEHTRRREMPLHRPSSAIAPSRCLIRLSARRGRYSVSEPYTRCEVLAPRGRKQSHDHAMADSPRPAHVGPLPSGRCITDASTEGATRSGMVYRR
jgi:hypothetical protein